MKPANLIEFFSEFFKSLFFRKIRLNETLEQIYQIGFLSLPVILFSVSFAAGVTILEYSYHIKLVIHSTSLVPGFAALLVIRELGAVITALLLTSRVGAGITAELGTMKISEQIDALRLLQINPFSYLVVPRFLAGIASSVMLMIFSITTCLFFCMLISVRDLQYTQESFVTALTHFASFQDIILAMVKAAVFGAVIPVVSCFYGFHCTAGAEGVGRSTTAAVVANAVLIIILDFILTSVFSWAY